MKHGAISQIVSREKLILVISPLSPVTTRYNYYSFKRMSSRRFPITEKAPTRAFSWLKAPTY